MQLLHESWNVRFFVSLVLLSLKYQLTSHVVLKVMYFLSILLLYLVIVEEA